jgi:hypothetical protein
MAEIWSRRRFCAKTKKTRKIDLPPPVTFFPYVMGGCRLARLRVPPGRTFWPEANLLPRKTTELGAQKCHFCHFCNFGGSPKIHPRADRPRFAVSDFFRRAESNGEDRVSVSRRIRVAVMRNFRVSCSVSNRERGRVGSYQLLTLVRSACGWLHLTRLRRVSATVVVVDVVFRGCGGGGRGVSVP